MRALRLALLATAAFSTPAIAATPARPNIVILLMDDWGFSDVGSFGGEIATPNIDALAAQGVRFSNFHVAGSCSPTRAMLQTGVSSHRAGLGNMPETLPPAHAGKPGYDTVMNRRVVTIADLLRRAGYRTYLTGKWHLGMAADRLPTARGYDHAFALSDAGADNFEQKPIEGLYRKAGWTDDGRPGRLPANYYSSRFVVDKMIDYIERGRASGKPFLASVNFLANHIPVQAPDADIARYANAYKGGWSALRLARQARAKALGVVPPDARMAAMASTPEWRRLSAEERFAQARAMAAYGGMATAADREIGRLIAHLKASGDYPNTVFVFLSDNGPEPLNPRSRWLNRLVLRHYYDFDPAKAGRKGTMTYIGPAWASAAASPLWGYKFTAAEGGMRVPLIVAAPNNPRVKGGRIAARFAYVTDIVPTLLDLAGVAKPAALAEPIAGTSLLPVLEDASDAAHPPSEPIGYELSGNAALFRGDYKLVKNLPPLSDGRWRLYDIARDPGEAKDLSSAEPDRFSEMRADYAAFSKRDQVLPMPAGYTADQQINDNAFRNVMLPRLKQLAPWALGIAVLLFSALVRWRRRRRMIA